MRHGDYFRPYFFTWNWITFAILIILFTIIVTTLIVKFLNNKRKYSESDLTDKQNETLENFSGLVHSMLSQQGSGLKQSEISVNLSLPLSITAEKLLEMEKAGEITRKWENDDYTFIISIK